MEDSIVVYSTYYNPIEANIIKSKLDDAQIPCFLTDENISTIQPLYNQAVGGVKLNVFQRDVPYINELLAEDYSMVSEQTTTDEKFVCEVCHSTNVGYGQSTTKRFSLWVTIISLIMFVYPFKANKCFHCYNCGHEFT